MISRKGFNMRYLQKSLLLVVATGVLITAQLSTVLAEEPKLTQEQTRFFETHIRPALAKYCYECHSVKEGTARSGLLLDTREAMLQGGDSGPSVTPGNPDKSLIWEAITWSGLEMPPSQKMPADVIAHFKKWIEMGAPDPRVRKKVQFNSKITANDIESAKNHWAFQSPVKPAIAGIDALVVSQLKQAGLKPAPPAEPLTLLRRLHFDLNGLPATPAEVRQFEAAWRRDPGRAVQSKVNQLLARPQFGERWGRHWLDLARYAESSGAVNVTYPHAWRYRDYVIDSFNRDTPYNQFLTEQLAGDLLPARNAAERQKNLIATGFLAVGMKRQDERNPKKFLMDMIDEQINTVSQVTLGLTVACARCHDHKYDAIPANDYYALAGIFLSTDTRYGTVWGQQNHRPAELIELPVKDKADPENQLSIAQIEAQIRDIQSQMRKDRAEARRTGVNEMRKFVQYRNRVAKLQGLLTTINPDGTKKTFGMGVLAKKPVDATIYLGGDILRPAQAVDRGFLQVLSTAETNSIPAGSTGRRELAEWITSPRNPLTARVMVNRIWSHLLGDPLVATPNNWGAAGLKPENAPLLDYLAVQFMEYGWSVKALIREIVLSDAYQRSSQYIERNAEVDPGNRLHWRVSPRQLDAEALRDSMLAISGELTLKAPTGSEIGELGNGRFGREINENSFARINNHRSVYLPVVRNAIPESLNLFDFPDANQTSAGRDESIVATQSLYLLNNEFVLRQARAMAGRLKSISSSRDEQVRQAFLLVYGRQATPAEVRASLAFLNSMATMLPADRAGATASRKPLRGRPGMRPGARPGGRPGARPGGRPGAARPGGMRPGAGRPGGAAPRSQPATEPLDLLCQALMLSAEHRILD